MPPARTPRTRALTGRLVRTAITGLVAVGGWTFAAPVGAAAAAPAAAPATPAARCATSTGVTTCTSAPVVVRRATRTDGHGRTVVTTVTRVRTIATAAGIRTTTTRWTTRTAVAGRPTTARTRTVVTRKPVGTTTTPAGTPTAARRATPTAATASLAGAVLALTNVERAKAGLRPLRADARLDAVSRRWSATMARSGAFRHSGDWSWMAAAAARAGGENLYVDDFSGESTYAVTAVQAWMHSPGHRANILNPAFTRLGVGVAMSADGHRRYATQTFAG